MPSNNKTKTIEANANKNALVETDSHTRPFGRIRQFFESWFTRGRLKASTSVLNNYRGTSYTDLLDLIQQIKDVSQERSVKIREYRDMLSDGITLSAVELMSEDATQVDKDMNRVLWLTCPEDPEFEESANDFLRNKVKIDQIAYSLAFNIVTFGDVYLSTFYSDESFKTSGGRVGEYFEIETAEFVTHIFHYNKPSGYLLEPNPSSSRIGGGDDVVHDERDFIHFSADNGMNHAKITLTRIESDGSESDNIYTVKYGNSFLESARTCYKTRTLLNDLLLLSRLTRSQFYRLFSVDVGQSDDRETTRIIKELRDVISTSQTITLGNGITTNAAPISTGGNVYFPVRNGKGQVNVQEVGGEVDFGAMVDVDYFDNQYYGALKVPKQFLGQSEEMPGGIGDTTLTRLDIRYARTIRRIQTVIKEGVRKLIYWKCVLDEVVPKDFEIHMGKISSAEDDEHATWQEAQYSLVSKIFELLETADPDGKIDKLKLLPGLMNIVSMNDEVRKLIEAQMKEQEENKDEENVDDGEDEDMGW